MTEEDDKAQEENLELRTSLNDAYAAIEGQKSVQSFSAFTLEDALDQQIERIEGAGTPTRPNELNRVTRVVQNVIKAVASIKARPPEAFVDKLEGQDVNTKP